MAKPLKVSMTLKVPGTGGEHRKGFRPPGTPAYRHSGTPPAQTRTRYSIATDRDPGQESESTHRAYGGRPLGARFAHRLLFSERIIHAARVAGSYPTEPTALLDTCASHFAQHLRELAVRNEPYGMTLHLETDGTRHFP